MALSYNPLTGKAIGPATKLDDDGNPTPNSLRPYPGRSDPFPEGTVYYANEYPSGISGSMQFIWEKGKWVWRWGEFRDSNSDGDYVRDASGSQRCESLDGTALTTSTAAGNIWVSAVATLTFPAVFSGEPKVVPMAEWASGGTVWGSHRDTSTTQVQMRVTSYANTSQGYPGYIATGRWKA